MAEIITLEGSILPSAHLARGERQDFRIGSGGGIEIAGFFQRKGAVIGFRERVFVDLFHGALLTVRAGLWQWRVAGANSHLSIAERGA